MTKGQRRGLFAKCVTEASLADVRAQRDAFEAYVAEHAEEIDDGDRADLEDARKIYADAIASKRAEDRRQVAESLVLAAIVGSAMWWGIATGNGWPVAGSLVLFLVAGGTPGGQRLLLGLSNLLLGLAVLGIVILAIGAATLFVLALTGNLAL